MRVLVLGAYGLVGSYVVARLIADGHDVLGAGRSVDAARRRFPAVHWVQADLARDSVEAWRPHLDGVEAVVNCAGALQDGPRDRLSAVHDLGLGALIEACKRANVRHFVQISAAGVEGGRDSFQATKSAGDDRLRRSGLDWVILRPGLVLARAVYGGSALLRGLAGFPVVIPALSPQAVVQVVDARDVAEAVARTLQPGAPRHITCDLLATEDTTLADVLLALRSWLGFTPAPVVRAPSWLGWAAGAVADGLGHLGWRSPMRTTALRQLQGGVRGRSADAPEKLGLTPKPLAQIMASEPSSVSDRWFARLYFAKPLGLVTLAFFWAASGLIGLLNAPAATALLQHSGFTPALAQGFVVGGSLLDLLLAALICHRKTATLALLGMVDLTIAYLTAAAWWTPHLWLDPLGPLVKSIPAAVLAVLVLGMMEER